MNINACRPDNRLLALAVASILPSALMSAWCTLDWMSTVNNGLAANCVASYKVVLRLSMGLTFLALSFLASRPKPQRIIGLRLCAVCAGGSVLLHVAARLSGMSFFLTPAVILAGMTYASFIQIWIAQMGRYDRGVVFATALFATALSIFFSVSIASLGLAAGAIASIAFPILSILVFGAAKAQGVFDSEIDSTSIAPRPLETGGLFWSQTLGLVLCSLASGISSLGTAGGAGPSNHIVALVTLGLGATAAFVRMPSGPVTFSGFVLYTCTCIVMSLLIPQGSEWCTHFARAGFWVLIAYSFEWFAQHNDKFDGHLGPVPLRGLAAIYLTSVFAEVVGDAMPKAAPPVVALALLIITLVLVLLGSTGNIDASARTEKQDETDDNAQTGQSIDVAVRIVAQAHGLTEPEQEMLACLARGYSLKRAAESMVVSESNAKYRRHNLYQKLGITSRQELINMIEAVGEERIP